MRASMARLTPRFSTNRVVREYTEKYYVPAAVAYRARAADHGQLGTELIKWRQALTAHWPETRFGAVSAQSHGTERRVAVDVWLGGLAPEAVLVELYAEPVAGGEPERHAMKRTRELGGRGYEYCVTISAARALGDYTPRLLPRHPSALIPLEAQEILWQR
jgi:starch phosphorylase